MSDGITNRIRKLNVNGKVIVLLSSYNGSKYIAEQLQSIIEQEYSGHITILIRDDGSSDDTVSIIKSTVCPKNRVILLMNEMINSVHNIGPQRSFLSLIESAPSAEYYFLADQDDVWKTDHVSSAVEMLQRNDMPVLYCANYSLVDSELNLIKESVLESVPQFSPLKAF